jgi:EAL domain-containing protein (putative c-di-GMP-specific phosphodiesterase class I)
MASVQSAGHTAVLEIHESAVTDGKAMGRLRERLGELGIKLAYDDFGAGQSRLMELVEVPPEYLKLDITLVRDIDQSERRQDLVRALLPAPGARPPKYVARGLDGNGAEEEGERLGRSGLDR